MSTISIGQLKQAIKDLEATNGNIDSMPIFISVSAGEWLDEINPSQLEWLDLANVKLVDADNDGYKTTNQPEHTTLKALVLSVEE